MVGRTSTLECQTFPDARFDLVITQDVLEHLFDPKAAFREIARTLRPGGAQIFTVPLVQGRTKASTRRATQTPSGAIEHSADPDPKDHGQPTWVQDMTFLHSAMQPSQASAHALHSSCSLCLSHSALQSSSIELQSFAIWGKRFDPDTASFVRALQPASISLTAAEHSARLVSPVANIVWQWASQISPATWQSAAARISACSPPPPW